MHTYAYTHVYIHVKEAEALGGGEERHGDIVRRDDDGRLIPHHAEEDADDHPHLAKKARDGEGPRQREGERCPRVVVEEEQTDLG